MLVPALFTAETAITKSGSLIIIISERKVADTLYWVALPSVKVTVMMYLIITPLGYIGEDQDTLIELSSISCHVTLTGGLGAKKIIIAWIFSNIKLASITYKLPVL